MLNVPPMRPVFAFKVKVKLLSAADALPAALVALILTFLVSWLMSNPSVKASSALPVGDGSGKPGKMLAGGPLYRFCCRGRDSNPASQREGWKQPRITRGIGRAPRSDYAYARLNH